MTSEMSPVTASLSPTASPRGPLFPRAPCSPFSPVCPCKGFQMHRDGFYRPPQAQLISKSIFYDLLSRHEVHLVPLGPGTWSRQQRQVKGRTELLSFTGAVMAVHTHVIATLSLVSVVSWRTLFTLSQQRYSDIPNFSLGFDGRLTVLSVFHFTCGPCAPYFPGLPGSPSRPGSP